MRKFLFFISNIAFTITCQAFDPNDFREEPSGEAAYYAQAEFRSFTGFVQVLEPNDVARRQYDNGLLVEAHMPYICHIIAEPKPLPANQAKTITKILFTNNQEAKEQIMNGPMMGPFTAFVLYDKNKKPLALTFQQLSVFITSHVQEVGGNDMYQRIGDWKSYSYCHEFTKHVGIAMAYTPQTETPFLKWKNQKP